MATLSPVRKAIPVIPGLELLHRGKVRDTYRLTDDLLLQVVTDAVSIFDFLLNAKVPLKGYVLAALSVFWFKKLEAAGMKTHLVAFGADIDQYLPEALRNNPDLQSRALVVKKNKMAPVEFVFRSCLTGSAMDPKKRCGNVFPDGMQEGDMFEKPIFTPTDKAEEGNDKPLDFRETEERFPEACAATRAAYEFIAELMKERGLMLVDGKLEASVDGVLCDELGTPDACRVVGLWEWELSREQATGRKLPPTFDKQFVRAWGISQGINNLKPENPEHVETVHGIKVPSDVILRTTKIYEYIFWRITSVQLDAYQRDVMGVKSGEEKPKRRVAIVCGSESDLPVVDSALGSIGFKHQYFVHVISCHRNPEELREFAMGGCECAEIVIAVGSKAFALPGVLAGELRAAGYSIPVVGVALGKEDSAALNAAMLSISELPERTVVMDEIRRRPYAGLDGLCAALMRVDTGEFPPPRPGKVKPPQYGVRTNLAV